MRRSVKQGLWWGGMAVVGFLALLLVIPLFLNPAYIKMLALEQIQRALGSHVSVGETSFALFPQPQFFLKDVVVKERPESHAVFRAQSMELELGIRELLFQHIVVREFYVEQPEIELRRNASGTWRFLSHSSNMSPVDFLAKLLVMEKFVIVGGKIVLIDESPRDTVRGFVIEDVEGLSETFHEGTQVSSTFDLSGSVRQSHGAARWQVQGQLEAVLKSKMPSLGSPPDPFDHVTFTGHIMADQVEINQISEYLPHAESLSRFPGVLKLESQVKWVQRDNTSQLILNDVDIASQFITLDGAANIEELEDGHLMMGFTMRSSNVDLEVVRQYVPTAWIPESLGQIWKKGQWGGKLEIMEGRLLASTRQDVETSVTGTFQLTNGYVDIAEWPTTEDIRGTVLVEPDRIQLSDVHGTYDGIPVEMKEGIFLFKDSGPWGDVEIRGPVPAGKVLEVVKQLGGNADSNLLSTWSVKQGGGWLRLRFAGHLLEAPGLKFQYGEYLPQDLVLHIHGIPQPFTHGHGKIIFSRESTVLEGLQGRIGVFPLLINGTILHQEDVRFEQLAVQALMDGRNVLSAWSPNLRKSDIQMDGALKASVSLTGSVRQPKFKGWIDGSEAFIYVPSFIQKHAGEEGTLEFDGQFHSSGVLHFSRVELTILPLRLHGQGLVRYRPELVWEGRFDSGPMYLGLLPEGIQVFNGAIQSGILEIQLKGHGRGTDWKRWNTTGWVSLTEGVVSVRGLPDPVSNLFVRLKVDQDQLDLKRLEFRLKDSEAVISGFMKHWKTTPVVSAMMEAPQFDLDLLIPKKGRSAIRDGIEWLAARGILEGSVHVEHPRYKELSGKNLSAVVKIHDNLVSVDKVQMMVEEQGSLSGRFFIHLPEGKPAAMRASFQAEHLPFEHLLQVAGDEKRMITGRLNVRGMIQGHGRDMSGIVPTLNGNVDFTLREGYVRKGTILPRILTLLNLPHILRGKLDLEETGFPFSTVKGQVKIEEGIFSTTNFLLDSSIMKMSAAGMYEWPVDHLKGIAAVSPFGPYSDLIKNIPLFGRIFSGDRKGIATAMFSVQGPLADPEVEYMPVESLKTGLTGLAQLAIDVLKNTLTLPYDLIREAGDAPAPPSSVVEPAVLSTPP